MTKVHHQVGYVIVNLPKSSTCISRSTKAKFLCWIPQYAKVLHAMSLQKALYAAISQLWTNLISFPACVASLKKGMQTEQV